MKITEQVKKYLGAQIKNKTNDLEGICVIVGLRANGAIQLGMQRKGEKDSERMTDEPAFAVIGDGMKADLPEINTPKFKAGQKVRSTVSDCKGTITSTFFHLNGCVTYYIVAPEVNKHGIEIVESYAEYLLELVPETKPVEVAQTQTGGPSSAVPMMRH